MIVTGLLILLIFPAVISQSQSQTVDEIKHKLQSETKPDLGSENPPNLGYLYPPNLGYHLYDSVENLLRSSKIVRLKFGRKPSKGNKLSRHKKYRLTHNENVIEEYGYNVKLLTSKKSVCTIAY